MEQAAIAKINSALKTAHEFAHASHFEGCDAGDIDELIESATHELQKSKPSVQTLATFMNSIARSLRADELAREVCMQLDAAMRSANVPTNWEEI